MTPEDVYLRQEWLAEEYVKSEDQRKRCPTVCQFLHIEKAFLRHFLKALKGQLL